MSECTEKERKRKRVLQSTSPINVHWTRVLWVCGINVAPGQLGPFDSKCMFVCVVCAFKTPELNSRQWAVVRSVAVWSRVGAGRVGEDSTWCDDDRPPLLLLPYTSLPLVALDVLDGLERGGGGGGWVMLGTTAPSSVHKEKYSKPGQYPSQCLHAHDFPV